MGVAWLMYKGAGLERIQTCDYGRFLQADRRRYRSHCNLYPEQRSDLLILPATSRSILNKPVRIRTILIARNRNNRLNINKLKKWPSLGLFDIYSGHILPGYDLQLHPTALRYFKTHKTYTAANLLGLTLGFACFLLLNFYVSSEKNFDRQHGHVYRLLQDTKDGQGKILKLRNVLPARAPAPKSNSQK